MDTASTRGCREPTPCPKGGWGPPMSSCCHPPVVAVSSGCHRPTPAEPGRGSDSTRNLGRDGDIRRHLSSFVIRNDRKPLKIDATPATDTRPRHARREHLRNIQDRPATRKIRLTAAAGRWQAAPRPLPAAHDPSEEPPPSANARKRLMQFSGAWNQTYSAPHGRACRGHTRNPRPQPVARGRCRFRASSGPWIPVPSTGMTSGDDDRAVEIALVVLTNARALATAGRNRNLRSRTTTPRAFVCRRCLVRRRSALA